MNKKLKPCPFCGSDKIMFAIEGYFKPWENTGLELWYRCHCYGCGADGMDTGMCKDMKQATKNWNERVELQPISLKPLGGADISGKEYKICRNCSAIVEDGEWQANYCPDCGMPVDWSEVAE